MTSEPTEATGTFSAAVLLVALGAIAIVVVLVRTSMTGDFMSTAEPPDFGFIRDGEALVVANSTESTVAWELPDRAADASMFIESVEPIDARRVLVGVCCEPPEGRQRLIDISTATLELLPIDSRFPFVSEDGSSFVSGGFDVRLEELRGLLAYEAGGIGVVVPGPVVRNGEGEFLFRPVTLPDDRVAFVDGTSGPVVVTDEMGVELLSTTIERALLIDYDPINDVVLVLSGERRGDGSLAGDTIDVLSVGSLASVTQWTLTEPVSAIDVRNGWILLSDTAGSLRTRPLADPYAPAITLVESNVSAASWLR